MAYLFSIIILCGFIYYFFFVRKRTTSQPVNNTISSDFDTNIYQDFRTLAFGLGQNNLPAPVKVIMEWELGNGMATMVCSSDGDASIYLSNGTTIIGGAKHQNVRTLALKFVENASPFFNDATQVKIFTLPESGKVNLYRIDGDDKRIISEKVDLLQSGESSYNDLFKAGNYVLTEMRHVHGG
jgi:hypothetical protein